MMIKVFHFQHSDVYLFHHFLMIRFFAMRLPHWYTSEKINPQLAYHSLRLNWGPIPVFPAS